MPVERSSRAKIMQCAADLFLRQGYRGTSIDDILAVCSVSRSNFYYHFRGKDDLAAAVLTVRMERFSEHGLSILQSTEEVASARLARFGEFLINSQAAGNEPAGCPFSVFAEELGTGGASELQLKALVLSVFAAMRDALEECIRSGAGGCFRSDLCADDLAQLAAAAIQGAMLYARVESRTDAIACTFSVLNAVLRQGGADSAAQLTTR